MTPPKARDHRSKLVPSPLMRFACLVALVACGKVEPAGARYVMVDELGDPAASAGRDLQVHGFAERGTIQSTVIDQRMLRTFVLHKADKRVRVVITGPVPDTFRDEAETVVTGRLVASASSPIAQQLHVTDAYILEATELNAKCPSRYDGVASGSAKFQ